MMTLGDTVAKTHRKMHGLPTPDKSLLSAEKERPSGIRTRRRRIISYAEDEDEDEEESPQDV